MIAAESTMLTSMSVAPMSVNPKDLFGDILGAVIGTATTVGLLALTFVPPVHKLILSKGLRNLTRARS